MRRFERVLAFLLFVSAFSMRRQSLCAGVGLGGRTRFSDTHEQGDFGMRVLLRHVACFLGLGTVAGASVVHAAPFFGNPERARKADARGGTG